MERESRPTGTPAPLGEIEPHAGLLWLPAEGQLLYKVMKVEHLLRSIRDSYIHFNRVDQYADFAAADKNDSAQLPGDRQVNEGIGFARSPSFKVSDYYERARARTYACSFSLANTEHIWKMYANGAAKGKIAVVFDLHKLRTRLNRNLQGGAAALLYNGVRCRQVFSINYGVVTYVGWNEHRLSIETLPNPIAYAYLKSDEYRKENELRITLSALGIGHFVLDDMTEIDFPRSLHLDFDYRAALADHSIVEFVPGPDCDTAWLCGELELLGIKAR